MFGDYNTAAVNIHVQILNGHVSSNHLRKKPRCANIQWHGRTIFGLSETAELSSKVAFSIGILSSNTRKFLLLHILTSIWYCQLSVAAILKGV